MEDALYHCTVKEIEDQRTAVVSSHLVLSEQHLARVTDCSQL